MVDQSHANTQSLRFPLHGASSSSSSSSEREDQNRQSLGALQTLSLSHTHRTADPVLGGTKLAAIVSIFFDSFGGHVSFTTYEFHVHAMMIQ